MFYDTVKESVEYIKSKITIQPEIGFVLGSGLGALVEMMEECEVLSYDEIPHFPKSFVEGHAGNLVFGKLSGKSIVMMQGRFHYYEGFTMKEVTYPIFVMNMLGAKDLFLTNACGGINRKFNQGDLMIITDFINSVSTNPLIGVNDDRFGPRFPDMSEPFSMVLRDLAKRVAQEMKLSYLEGVYTFFQGPYYETAAEIRLYERAGSDAVGMSTVPETIVANYLGMRVLAIACITNMATGICTNKHSHENVLKTAETSGQLLKNWIVQIIKEL